MVTLLQKVGSEKNGTQVSGDLALHILVKDTFTEYSFYDYFNGVDYAGIRISFGNSSGTSEFVVP